MRAARRAGSRDASAAMAPSSTTTIVYVGTSYGVTPKSSVPSERRTSSEPAMPIDPALRLAYAERAVAGGSYTSA